MSAPVNSFVGDLRYASGIDREVIAVVPVQFGGLVTLDPLTAHSYSSASLVRLANDGMCPVVLGHCSHDENDLKVFNSSGQRRFHSSAAWRWLQPWA
ncbi:MAG: hypothetical protein ACRDRI_19225 [Pseudonocardiaceae bacterium]